MQLRPEKEQFELIRENLRLAVEDCRAIATQYETGFRYTQLRKHLLTAEDACRDLMWLREDVRWSEFSLLLPKCQEISRRWLTPLSLQGKKVFSHMAESLAWLLAYVERMRTQKTGRRGIILPEIGKIVTHVPGPSLRHMVAQGTA